MKPNISALVGTIENHPESTSESDTGSFTLTRQQRPQPQVGSKRRPRQTDKKTEKMRPDLNSSMRLTEQQIEHLNNSMRMSERNERMDRIERIDSRDRLHDSRLDRSDRMNESRMDKSDQLNDSRVERCNRLNDSRIERMNDSRIDRSDRLNDSRNSRIDRMCDMDSNDSRDRLNDSRIERISESSRIERMERMNDSRDRTTELNESRVSRDRFEDRRISDLNASIRIDGSPKMRPHISPLKMPKRSSPKNLQKEKELAAISSPLSPNTEESLLSDEDGRPEIVYSNEPEVKCLGPDSQYEPVRENINKEELKTNHHHCYSDTNTMDSGWQSGSEKQVTD